MLKTYGLYVCIIVCLLFIQTTAILPWGNHGVRPDLLLFVVLWAAATLPAIHCACIILLLGLVFESLSGSPAGLFLSTYLFIFTFIYLLKRFFNFNTLPEFFALLLVCLAIKYLLLGFFIYFVYEYHYNQMFQTVFRETLFTMLLFPIVFPLIQKVVKPKQSAGAAPAQQ